MARSFDSRGLSASGSAGVRAACRHPRDIFSEHGHTIERVAEAGRDSGSASGWWSRADRISRGGNAVQLEPKAMDVLIFLARRAGELVDKRSCRNAVWQTEFVCYNTLVNRISELREALGDDLRDPLLHRNHSQARIPARRRVSFGATAQPEAAGQEEPLSEPVDERPRTGLSPFTRRTRGLLAREAEIAALWRKIAGRRLLAVVVRRGGQELAGAGRGGRPGAAAVRRWCAAGRGAILPCARALAPDLMDDADEMGRLLAFHDPDMGCGGGAMAGSRGRRR